MVTIELERCGRCGLPWPACTCGKPTPPGALDTFEPEPPAEPSPLDFEPPRETPKLPPKGPSATELAARAREQTFEPELEIDDGESYRAMGKLLGAEPEREPFTRPKPAPGSLVEWVQWRGKRGDLSLYHVRLSTGGFLLCGRHVPHGIEAAADSFPPTEKKCAVCLSKLRELAS